MRRLSSRSFQTTKTYYYSKHRECGNHLQTGFVLSVNVSWPGPSKHKYVLKLKKSNFSCIVLCICLVVWSLYCVVWHPYRCTLKFLRFASGRTYGDGGNCKMYELFVSWFFFRCIIKNLFWNVLKDDIIFDSGKKWRRVVK